METLYDGFPAGNRSWIFGTMFQLANHKPRRPKIVSEYYQEIPHGTARKSHSTITRNQEDKLSKATSSGLAIIAVEE